MDDFERKHGVTRSVCASADPHNTYRLATQGFVWAAISSVSGQWGGPKVKSVNGFTADENGNVSVSSLSSLDYDGNVNRLNSDLTAVKGGKNLSLLTNEDDARLQNLIATVSGDFDSRFDYVSSLVPSSASAENKLADKEYVVETIRKERPCFRGSWANWDAVPTDPSLYPVDYSGNTTPLNGDYIILLDASGAGKDGAWRFVYSGDWAKDGRNGWTAEYQISSVVFTEEQWRAINSGFNSDHRTEFDAHSGNWNSVYASVSEASAGWNEAQTEIQSTSADIRSTIDTVSSTSADWSGKQFALSDGINTIVSEETSSITTYGNSFRGQYLTRFDIPSSADGYPTDFYGRTVPQRNDTLVINEAFGQFYSFNSGFRGYFDRPVTDVACGNGVFVFALPDGLLRTSDFRTYEPCFDGSDSWFSVEFANGRFFASNRAYEVWTSVDGVDWELTNLEDGLFQSFIYGDGKFLTGYKSKRDSSVQNAVFTSVDGVTWTEHAVDFDKIVKFVYDVRHRRYFAIDGSRIYWSINGENWNAYSGSSVELNFVAYGNTVTVAMLENGESFIIDPNSSWRHYSHDFGGNVVDFKFLNGLFTLATSNGDIYVSKDGITWLFAAKSLVDGWTRIDSDGKTMFSACGNGTTRTVSDVIHGQQTLVYDGDWDEDGAEGWRLLYTNGSISFTDAVSAGLTNRLDAFEKEFGENARIWDSATETVSSLSGGWSDAATEIESTSANNRSVFTTVETASGDWTSVTSSVSSASGSWDSVYASVEAASADWESATSTLSSTSGNWDSVYTTVASASAIWSDGKQVIAELSGDLISVCTSVSSTSGQWNGAVTSLSSASGNWESTYASVSSASGAWDEATTEIESTSANNRSVFTTVETASGDWESVFDSVESASGNWDSTYASVSSASGDWNEARSTLSSASGAWESVVDSVSSASGNWDSVYTDVASASGRWNAAASTVESTSADLNSALDTLSSTSGDWNSAVSTVSSTSAEWSAKQNALTDGINTVISAETSSVTTYGNSFRGQYRNFASIPSSSTDYPLDFYGKTEPVRNDYLVVDDASDCFDWTRLGGLVGADVLSVAYGRGRFVLATENGLWTTVDGTNPTRIEGTDGRWLSVVFGGGRFVAGYGIDSESNGHGLWYSDDGLTWTQSDMDEWAWAALTFMDGTYFAGCYGFGGHGIWKSENGVTWTPTGKTDMNWLSMTNGNGTLVAAGSTVGLWYSDDDGETWEQSDVANANCECVCFGNGRFVSFDNATLLYSDDGHAWHVANAPVNGFWHFVCNINGIFLASHNGGVLQSVDGIDWTQQEHDFDATYYVFAHGNGVILGAAHDGNSILRTADAKGQQIFYYSGEWSEDGRSGWKLRYLNGSSTDVESVIAEINRTVSIDLADGEPFEISRYAKAIPVPRNGDTIVLRRSVSVGRWTVRAYIYSDGSWIAADGETDSKDLFLTDNLTTTFDIGSVRVGPSGHATIAASGRSMKDVLDEIFVKEVAPSATAPSFTVSAYGVGSYETGTRVTAYMLFNGVSGSYTFGPATQSAIDQYYASFYGWDKRTSEESVTFSTVTVSDAMSAGLDRLRMRVYARYTDDSVVPVTNLGTEVPSSAIVSGYTETWESEPLRSYRQAFYGTSMSKSVTAFDSDFVRSLEFSSGEYPTVDSEYTVPYEVGDIRVVFAYPRAFGPAVSITDGNTAHMNIVNAFKVATVGVADRSGSNPIPYYVYWKDAANPNDVPNKYTIRFKR